MPGDTHTWIGCCTLMLRWRRLKFTAPAESSGEPSHPLAAVPLPPPLPPSLLPLAPPADAGTQLHDPQALH